MKHQLLEKLKDVCQRGMKKERVKEKAGPNQAAIQHTRQILGCRTKHQYKEDTKRGSQRFRASVRLTAVPASQIRPVSPVLAHEVGK